MRFKATMLRSREGNVALVTALLAPIVVLIAGGAVDLTNASMRQAQLQSAADAAAIAAVARNSAGYADGVKMTNDGPINDSQIAQQSQAVFNADLQGSPVTDTTFNVSATKTGTTVAANVTASATFSTAILGLIGRNTISLSATSYAADNIPAYMNFYMLLDNTPSMGIGATPTDVSNIVAATNNGNSNFEGGCAFACHSTDSAWDAYDVVKAYAISKNIAINMRIDVVRMATQQLTQTAYNTEMINGIPNEFKMAVYDFGTATQPSYSLHQDSPLSPALTTTVYNNANAVALMLNPTNNNAFAQAGPPPTGSVYNDDEDTSFDYTMTQLGAAMLPNGTTAGNGTAAKSPVPILFLVTDGMVDQSANGRQMGGINPATCTALKNNGIKIAILYTTYIPQSLSDSWSQSNVAPLLPQIQPALQACASGPQYFNAVSPENGIPEAMAALFKSVVAEVRLTQ